MTNINLVMYVIAFGLFVLAAVMSVTKHREYTPTLGWSGLSAMVLPLLLGQAGVS